MTYTVVVTVPNAGGRLLPGMTATLRVVTEHRPEALRVPNAALRWRPAGERGPPGTDGAGGGAAAGAGPASAGCLASTPTRSAMTTAPTTATPTTSTTSEAVRPLLLAVVGPTATGKSDLGLDLAEAVDLGLAAAAMLGVELPRTLPEVGAAIGERLAIIGAHMAERKAQPSQVARTEFDDYSSR